MANPHPDPKSAFRAGVGWYALTWAGWLLAVVGLIQLLEMLVPPEIGNVEWEFGTISSFFDSIPLFGIGIGLVAAGSLARGSRVEARVVAVFLALFVLFLWAAAALYVTDLPLAIGAASDSMVLRALKKGILKTGVQALAYPFGFLWVAVLAWRRSAIPKLV